MLEFSMIHTASDARLGALQGWLDSRLAHQPYTLERASEDASFRRYFRARLADGRSYIAMDAPPEK